jgi:hypothetical protein
MVIEIKRDWRIKFIYIQDDNGMVMVIENVINE